jgi:hypothetical protein
MFDSFQKKIKEWFLKALPEDYNSIEGGIYKNYKPLHLFKPLDCFIFSVENNYKIYKTQCIAKIVIPKNSIVVKPQENNIIRSNTCIIEKLRPVLEKYQGHKILDAWIPDRPELNISNAIFYCNFIEGQSMIGGYYEYRVNHSMKTFPTDLEIIISEEEAIQKFKTIQDVPMPFSPLRYNNLKSPVYMGDEEYIGRCQRYIQRYRDKINESNEDIKEKYILAQKCIQELSGTDELYTFL